MRGSFLFLAFGHTERPSDTVESEVDMRGETTSGKQLRDDMITMLIALASGLGKMAVVVKTNQIIRSHFGAGAPPILDYFSGDWDVQWGYGIWTHGQMCLNNRPLAPFKGKHTRRRRCLEMLANVETIGLTLTATLTYFCNSKL